MKFGIFCLMPQRDNSSSVKQCYTEAVDIIRQAEEFDFDIAWFAEHHFSNYSVCPSPIMMAAHVAAVTKTIKLAPGILVLPLYNPVRLLEEIGMVDNLSDGRFIIGIGAGYQKYEFDRFKVPLEDAWELTHELLDIIELGFNQDSFSYSGKHIQLPQLPIAIQPLQKPMPPVFVAGNEPKMLQRMAKKGYTSFATVGYASRDIMMKVRDHVAAQHEAAGVSADQMRFAVQRYVYVTDSKSDALDAAERALYTTRVAMSLRGNYQKLNGTFLDPIPFEDELSLEQIVDNVIIGDAETCLERLTEEIRLFKPSHWSCFMQFGGMDGKRAQRSLERFGTEVLPKLHKEIPELATIGEPSLQ